MALDPTGVLLDLQMAGGKKYIDKISIALRITAIDISAAFDAINIIKLLEILWPIADEDELRLMQYLRSNTVLDTRIIKADIHTQLTSNVGIPHGDGLNTVLFIIQIGILASS